MAQLILQLGQEPILKNHIMEAIQIASPALNFGVSCCRNYSVVGLSHKVLPALFVAALRREAGQRSILSGHAQISSCVLHLIYFVMLSDNAEKEQRYQRQRALPILRNGDLQETEHILGLREEENLNWTSLAFERWKVSSFR
jgi:hypothetical protein